MNLLVLTNKPDKFEDFEGEFENVEYHSLADISINSGTDPKVKLKDRNIKEDFDAVYLDPEPKASIYSRVLLEALQEESVNANLKPNTFHILTKKHYLFKVLKEKGAKIPNTIAVPSEKGLTSVEKNIKFPAVAKMYENFNRKDIAKIDDADELQKFADRIEYGKNYLLTQEYIDGAIFDILYIDGTIISLKLEGEWEDKDVTRTYHTISADQKEEIRKAAESIGADICRARIVDDTIVQMKPELNLEMFKKISGKSVFSKVAKVLKGDDD